MAVKFKIIDLFAGCGGLSEGFMKSGLYNEIAAVEWLAPQVETLRYRMKTKWRKKDADERVMRFDIQRDDELFAGWDDPVFGQSKGLDWFVKQADGIDAIIGGPPCQSFSLAGKRMGLNDPRGRLVLEFIRVVREALPKAFVMENVRGLTNWEGGRALEAIQGEPSRTTYQDRALPQRGHGVSSLRVLFPLWSRIRYRSPHESRKE